MEFAVYSPLHGNHAFVLTPACMQPSLRTEKALGPLARRGMVAVDAGVLDAFGAAAKDGEFERVVTDRYVRRYIALLLAGARAGAPDAH